MVLAGVTAAVSAAVSMMGGVFLEAETERDTGGATASPLARAMWMLATDFLAAALPIAPFIALPVSQARWVAGGLTVALLTGLGWWRGMLGRKSPFRAALETNAIGIGAASAGTAAGLGIAYKVNYGTGTAPASAAAVTGTTVGGVQEYTNSATVTAADVHTPFTITSVITGLTIGTAYWLDLAAEAIATASDLGLSNVTISAIEF